MKNFATQKKSHTEINITSLIDVIFMLVIFMLIGASFEKPAIALTLPQAFSQEIPDKIFLTVSIDAQGKVYFENNEINIETLENRILAYGSDLRNVTVAMECDGGVSFDRVVAVMDTIKASGVRNVAIRHDVF
jgi:biopolymer transport protein ExbD